MEYKHIWDKTLNKDEEVKYEFSVGDRFRYIGMGFWVFFGVVVLLVSWLWGILLILGSVWYFSIYMKAANIFAFTDRRVLWHRGFFSTKFTTVEYSKITDVSVSEPFFESWIYKTGALSINTAGGFGKEIIFEHIEQPYKIKKKLDELRGNI